MKKIKIVFFLAMLIIPLFVGALTFEDYDTSVNIVRSYINKYKDNNKFLSYNLPYEYVNGVSKSNNLFTKAGFLSRDEYLISKGNYRSSYLATGKEYWTLSSESNNKQYYISYTLLTKNPNAKMGTRATEFVNPIVKVDGRGTYNNPWVFRNQHSVSILVRNKKYGSVSPNSGMVDNKKAFEFLINANPKYEYKSSDCNITKIENRYRTQPITKDTVCVLDFALRRFNINYVCGDGIGDETSQSVTYGDDYSILDYYCTRVGYTQDKWKATDGTQWTKGDKGKFELTNGEQGITENALNLSPVWKGNNYTVTFNSNGGSGNVPSQTATYGSAFTLTNSTFTKTGYTQDGWNDKADGTGNNWSVGNKTNWIWNIPNDVVLYAKWKPNTYTVTFDCNGGSGSVSSQTATYGQPFTLTSETCTKSGKSNNGWSENSNGSGTTWTRANTTNWTWNRTNNVTLYAKWCSESNLAACEVTYPCRTKGITAINGSSAYEGPSVCNAYTQANYWGYNPNGLSCSGATKLYIVGNWNNPGSSTKIRVCYYIGDGGSRARAPGKSNGQIFCGDIYAKCTKKYHSGYTCGETSCSG